MNSAVLTALLAAAAVALLGILMRRGAGASPPTSLVPPPPPESPAFDEEEGDSDDAAEEPVALTSDGWAFAPVGDPKRIVLLPPLGVDPLEPAPTGARSEELRYGDLLAARVTRGAPDHDPWRLEALGQDGEFRAWRFETREAAQAALALVIRCIVRTPLAEDGSPASATDADFAAARRLDEEIERELAAMPDVGEPPEER